MNGVFADDQGAGGRAGSRPVELMFGDHQNKPDVGMTITRCALI